MQSLFRYGLLAGALSLVLAACGDTGEGRDLGDPRGGFNVTVKSLDSLEEVESVTVTLSDSENTYTLELSQDSTDIEVWTGSKDNIYVGEYSVEAEAKNADGDVLYAAAPNQNVLIEQNQTVDLTIYLNQILDPDTLEFPHFESILLDKAIVEQWEDLTVTVTMVGGVGPYQIEGVNAINDGGWNFPGTFRDAEFTDNVGTIVWEPPQEEGPKWFKIVVTDANDNKAEVGVDVTVGQNKGAIAANVEFIMAPVTEITGRILNDNEGTSVYLWVKPANEAAGWTTSIAYEWEHDSCTGGAFETGDASGTWTAPAPSAGWYFKYQIERPAHPDGGTTPNGNPIGDPAGIGDCSITLKTTGDHGVTYAHEVMIDTEWVQPTT